MNHTNLLIIFIVAIITIFNSIFLQKRINLNNNYAVLMIESIMITIVIIFTTFFLDGYKKVTKDVIDISPRIWKMNLFLAFTVPIILFSKYFLMQNLDFSIFRILLLSMRVILFLIAGLIIFEEKMTLKKLLGAIIIIFGIILTAF
jgi:drug/metabolite transporter (DMT)-like permease